MSLLSRGNFFPLGFFLLVIRFETILLVRFLLFLLFLFFFIFYSHTLARVFLLVYLFVQSIDEETHGYVSGAEDMSGNVHLPFQVYHYFYSVLYNLYLDLSFCYIIDMHVYTSAHE